MLRVVPVAVSGSVVSVAVALAVLHACHTLACVVCSRARAEASQCGVPWRCQSGGRSAVLHSCHMLASVVCSGVRAEASLCCVPYLVPAWGPIAPPGLAVANAEARHNADCTTARLDGIMKS